MVLLIQCTFYDNWLTARAITLEVLSEPSQENSAIVFHAIKQYGSTKSGPRMYCEVDIWLGKTKVVSRELGGKIDFCEYLSLIPDNQDLECVIIISDHPHIFRKVVVQKELISYWKERRAQEEVRTRQDEIKLKKEREERERLEREYQLAEEREKRRRDAKILAALESRKRLDITATLSKHGFTNWEIAYIKSGLANMEPENGAVFIIEGLGMSLDLFDAIAEFRNLTPCQKLYVIIFTSEKFASAQCGEKPAIFLYLKEEFLYDWLPLSRSIISRLALITSDDL